MHFHFQAIITFALSTVAIVSAQALPDPSCLSCLNQGFSNFTECAGQTFNGTIDLPQAPSNLKACLCKVSTVADNWLDGCSTQCPDNYTDRIEDQLESRMTRNFCNTNSASTLAHQAGAAFVLITTGVLALL